MSIREIVEDFKNRIHGSEYEFHAKRQTLGEHTVYIKKAIDKALTAIWKAVEEGLPKNKKAIITCEKCDWRGSSGDNCTQCYSLEEASYNSAISDCKRALKKLIQEKP